MGKTLDELLWARYCGVELFSAAFAGTLVGCGLHLAGVVVPVSYAIATLLSTVIFSLLVGERLTRTPE